MLVSKKRLGRIAVMLSVITMLALPLSTSVTMASPSTVDIQMAVCVDGSGSISASDWTLMKEGLASAVEDGSIVPQDGSVELTIIQFAQGSATTEAGPTVIASQVDADAMASTIRGMSQRGSLTPMAAAFDEATYQITNSSNYSDSARQVINISTDGQPTHPTTEPEQAAIDARDAAIAAGIDEIHCEAVGSADAEWLRTQIAWPQPGWLVDPNFPPRNPDGSLQNGFVVEVDSYEEYADAIAEKFVIITNGTPIPSASTWSVIVAVTLLGAAALVVLRRRNNDTVKTY
ncbi:MAG: vWA domain-containing protein [Chloroflexota bacterium]|nr:vWA domain-containing protein [Chloroflexota bacterium]